MLQRQIDLFDEYKCRSMRDIVSAATAGDTGRPSPPVTGQQQLVPHHHRSSSDDVPRRDDDEARRCRPAGRPAGVVTVSRRDTMPPIHLMSATNQVRSAGPVRPQQLPLKLASTDSGGASRRTRWTSGGSPAGGQSRDHQQPSRDQQVSTDPQDGVHGTSRRSTGQRHGSTAKSPGLTSFVEQTPVTGELGELSTSLTTASAHDGPAVSTWTSPAASDQSGRVVSTSTPTVLLPMKLAERPRPKSASSTGGRVSVTGGETARPSKSSKTDVTRQLPPSDGLIDSAVAPRRRLNKIIYF